MRRASKALLALTLLTGTVRAESPPSCWDRVRNPWLTSTYPTHVRARELLALHRRLDPGLRPIALDRARLLLEEADAADSPDVRLRFDLGEVYERQERHDQAISVLQEALRKAPEHPGATDGWLTLAYAYGKLGRSSDELRAYQRFLALTLDIRSRATATLNLAEAEMHLGALDDAVRHYREAFDVASQFGGMSSAETAALAVWGLAVALDRSGDWVGALEQAALAIRLDPDEQLIGHGPNVFFVPDYERQWYLALAAVAHARDASKADDAKRHWKRAELHFATYATRATPDDRWLALARRRLLHVRGKGERR
jgi:tetratricopeptide (TPR) repeat protein